MKTEVIKKEGKKGTITLDDGIFGLDFNNDLVYQAVTTHRANSRQKIAHTKGTSEVRGGGRKPWRQKGTGRARHGSIRSPLWRGGGVTFGPSTDKKYGKKINRKMKRKALFMVLSKKIEEGEILIYESLKIENPKTKEAEAILKDIISKKEDLETSTVLFVPENDNKKFAKAAKNLPNTDVIRPDSVNIYDILSYKYVVFDTDSIKELINHFKQDNE